MTRPRKPAPPKPPAERDPGPPPPSSRAGPPPHPAARPPPGHSRPSSRAGLPTDRAAWLALVLPAIDASRTHAEVAAALTAQGHALTWRPVREWHLWLEAASLRGELPEHPAPLPERRAGARPGECAIPVEAARRGAAATNAARWGTAKPRKRRAK